MDFVRIKIQGKRSTMALSAFEKTMAGMKKPVIGVESSHVCGYWDRSWDLDMFVKNATIPQIVAALRRMPSQLAAQVLLISPARAPKISMLLAAKASRQYTEIIEEIEIMHADAGVMSVPIAATA